MAGRFPSVGGSLVEGFAAGRADKQYREQQQAAANDAQAKRIREGIKASRTTTEAQSNQILEEMSNLAAAGMDINGAEIGALREVHDSILSDYAEMIQEVRMSAEMAGIDPAMVDQTFGDPAMFARAQMARVESQLALGRSKYEASQVPSEVAKTATVDGVEQKVIERTDPKTGEIQFFTEVNGERVEVDGSRVAGATQRTQDVPMAQPTTTTMSRVQKAYTDAGDALSRNQQIQATFDPEFLTMGGKLKALGIDFAERINPELIPEEWRGYMERYQTFVTNAADNMNRYIKEITGAQMSQFEAERLLKAIPDYRKMGPTKFLATLQTNARQISLARARAAYLMNNGLVDFDALSPKETTDGSIDYTVGNAMAEAVSLEQMETIIEQRYEQLIGEGVGDAEALEIVRRDFGL